MYDLKVYLAGKMGGLTFKEMNDWRVEAKTILEEMASNAGCKILVINPVSFYNFEVNKQQTDIEVENYDLAHVVSSDVIMVNLNGLDSSDGTKFELFEAYKHYGIPVIAFGDKGLYYKLHPWIKSKITRVENSIVDACNYIRDYYICCY